MRAKFVAMQHIVSDIMALSNLNTAIRDYVTGLVKSFVTTHMTIVENEMR